MNINTLQLWLKTDEPCLSDASKVRGYVGNEFKQYPLLHNHYGENKYLFSYPLVQYKIIDGNVLILGIEEGVDILKIISNDLHELKLDKTYRISEKIIYEKEYDVKPSSEEHHYRFIVPWIALNQNNYDKFNKTKDWKDKKYLLNKILVGNILSMSKGLGIVVNKRLYAKSNYEIKKIKYKSVILNAFIGEFKVHYDIPDYFGLGKGVSHGFGTVKKILE